MLTQISARERFGYVVLISIVLFTFGFVGMKQLKASPEIKLEPIPQKSALLQPPAGSDVVVHVVGRVRTPGLVKLPAGSRVMDAVQDRGGAAKDADLESINLAAKLEDGTQLLVPAKGKVEVEKIAEPYRGGGSDVYRARPAAKSSSNSSGGSPAAKSISLNSAGQAQLESLPGIGPATAQKILEYRKAHGGFSSIDELLAVKGIGPKKLEAMRPFLRL